MISLLKRNGKRTGIFIGGFIAITFFAATLMAGGGPIQLAATDTGDKPAKPKTEYTDSEKAMADILKTIEAIDKEEGLSLEEKQQKALEFIKNYRYGPDNKDYFWVNNLQGKMLMHPTNKGLVGKVVTNIRDAAGKLFFVDLLSLCLEKGGGFVNYLWPEPGKEDPVPKTSFAQLYKSWGWMICTGIYMDTIEAYSIEPVVDVVPLTDDVPTDDREPASPV